MSYFYEFETTLLRDIVLRNQFTYYSLDGAIVNPTQNIASAEMTCVQ